MGGVRKGMMWVVFGRGKRWVGLGREGGGSWVGMRIL